METTLEKDINKDAMIQEMIIRHKQGFAYGEVTPWLKEIAAEYNITFANARFTYYNDVRDKEEDRLAPEHKKATKGKSTKKRKAVVKGKDKSEVVLAQAKTKSQKEETTVPQVEETQIEIKKEVQTLPQKETTTPKREEAKKSGGTMDEKIETFIHSTPSMLQPLKTSASRPSKPPYKFGDEVEAEVLNIVGFGAFLEITDGYGYRGLLHVSEIRDMFIDNIANYIKVGEIIKVKIKLAQDESKIQFSTRSYKVIQKVKTVEEAESTLAYVSAPPKNNILGEKLAQVKDKLHLSASSQQAKPVTQTKPVMQTEIEGKTGESSMKQTQQITSFSGTSKPTLVKVETNNQTNTEKMELAIPNLEEDKELQEMIAYLNNKLGALSPKAIAMLAEIKKEVSVFRLTPALLDLYQEFEVDLGVVFMNTLRKKVGECL